MVAFMLNAKTQQGLTLIELMISMLIGAVLLGGYSKQFIAIEVSEQTLARETMLTNEGHHLMGIMQKDIARAGFFYRVDAVKNNPFFYADMTLVKSNAATDCISYRYDKNKDGVLNSEYFGFRLNKKTIQRSKGSAIDCNAITGWESISDSANLSVDILEFNINEPEGNEGRSFIKIKLVLSHYQDPNSMTEFNRNVLVKAML